MKLSAAPRHAVLEMLAHPVRHKKLGVFRPAVAALGEAYLLLAERLAVGCARVVLMRRAIADVAFDDDQGRHVRCAPENLNGLRQPLGVVGVAHAMDVPAIGQEARRDVVAERQIRVSLYRDAVAVVDPAEVAEHLMPGKGRRFAGHALHHVPVAAHDINVVVEHREVRAVEMLGEPASGDGHADARGAPLAQRPGGRLDSGGQVVLGMSRTFAVELAEPLDVVERDREFSETFVLGVDCLDAGEVQRRVQQHGSMAVGQNETVAVWPDRIVGVEAQELLPKRIDHRRQCHRRAGMAGIGLLHGIHRERANGVNAKLIDCAVLCASASRCLRCRFQFDCHRMMSRDLGGGHAIHPVEEEDAPSAQPVAAGTVPAQ